MTSIKFTISNDEYRFQREIISTLVSIPYLEYYVKYSRVYSDLRLPVHSHCYNISLIKLIKNGYASFVMG